MMRQGKIKQILSFVLAVIMLTTSLGLGVLADSSNKSIRVEAQNSYSLLTETNYLSTATMSNSAKLPTEIETSGNGSITVKTLAETEGLTLNSKPAANLFDGKTYGNNGGGDYTTFRTTTTTANFAGNFAGKYLDDNQQAASGRTDAKDCYFDILFDLGGTLTPDKLVIANLKGGSGFQYLNHFAIFGATTLDELETAPVINREVKNSGADRAAKMSGTAQWTVTFNGYENIRYIKIRVYSLWMSNGEQNSFSIDELQLTGTQHKTVQVEAQNSYSLLTGTNYLSTATMSYSAKLPTEIETSGNGSITVKTLTETEGLTLNSKPATNLFDGKTYGNNGGGDYTTFRTTTTTADFAGNFAGKYLDDNQQTASGRTGAKDCYFDILFDLGGTVTPDKLVIANLKGGSGFQYLNHFAIFGATTLDELETAPAINQEVKNSGADRAAKMSGTAQWTATFNGYENIRYIKIRVYSLWMNNGGQNSFSIDEIQLTGTNYRAVTVSQQTAYSLLTETNYLSTATMSYSAKLPTEIETSGNGSITVKTLTETEGLTLNSKPATNLFDGKTYGNNGGGDYTTFRTTTTTADFAGNFAGKYLDDNQQVASGRTDAKDCYFDILFDLGGTVTPDKLVIANLKGGSGFQYLNHFAIFGATTLDELETAPAINREVKNSGADRAAKMSGTAQWTATFNGYENIRYIKIRVYSLWMNNGEQNSFSIDEIQLTGNSFSKAKTINVTEETAYSFLTEKNYFNTGNMTLSARMPNSINEEHGKITVTEYKDATVTDKTGNEAKYLFDGHVLNGPTEMDNNHYAQFGFSDSSYVNKRSGVYLDDESQETTGRTGAKDCYVDILFDLGGTLTPDKMVIANVTGGNGNAQYLNHFEIFGATELEDLYTNPELRREVKNNATTKTNVKQWTVEFAECENIRYVGIRIYSLWMNGGEARTFNLDELQLTGTDFVKDGQQGATHYGSGEMFTDEMMPEGNNLIQGKDAISTTYGAYAQKTSYFQYIFNLGQKIVPTQALVASRQAKWAVKHYAIYGSDKETDLFNSENQLAEVYNTGDDTLQTVTTIQGAKAIQYYGIRVYSYEGNAVGENVCRLGELQLNGVAPGTASGALQVETVESDSFQALNYNYLSEQQIVSAILVCPSDAQGNTTEGSFQYGNGTTVDKLFDGSANVGADVRLQGTYNGFAAGYYLEYVQQMSLVSNASVIASNPITNGIIDTSASAKVRYASEENVKAQVDANTRLVYTIDDEDLYSLSTFVISSANVADSKYWLSKYNVYASKTKSNLFDKENLIYSYDSSEDIDELAHSVVVNLKESVNARFVAIEIVTPVARMEANNIFEVALCEIAFYGEYCGLYKPENGPTYYGVDDAFMTEHLEDLGESIIGNKKPNIVNYNGVTNTTYSPSYEKNKEFYNKLTNETIETSAEYIRYQDEEANLDFIWMLDEDNPYDLSHFVFSGHIGQGSRSKTECYIGKYEVYAAVDYDDLFLPENMICSYDWTQDTPDDPAHTMVYGFEESVRACYVAVRVKSRATVDFESALVRICEIGFYGEKAIIIPEETNLTSNMPVRAYSVTNKGSLSELPVDVYSRDEVNALSDGNRETYVTLNNDKKRTDFLVDLCQSARINEIQVLFKEGTKVPAYTIYASTNYSLAWDESTLVYSYDGTNDGVRFGDGDDAMTMRYVRVSIPSGLEEVSLADIQVIGLDNQLLKNKHLGRSLSVNSNVQTYKMNVSDKNKDYLSLSTSEMKSWFDGENYTASVVEGCIAGESTYNILMYLGDLRCINEISLYYTRNFTRLHPTEVNVYCGEIREEVFNEDAKPTYTFKGLPAKGVQKLELIPTLARYVRVEYVMNNWDSSWTEEEIAQYDGDFINKEHITIALTEIDICGTSVVGIQNDSVDDTLLHFEDAETGISWDIVRIDRNDIISNVYSSKLVKYAATQEQKASLASTLYKIEGDYLYGIKFYDVMGNEVTYIQDRYVRMYFPAAKELLDYNSMVAEAVSNTKMSHIESGIGDDYVSADVKYSTDMRLAFTVLTAREDPYWQNLLLGNNSEDPKDDTSSAGGESSLAPSDSTLGTTDEETMDEPDTDTNAETKETVTTTKTITTKGTPVWLWVLLGTLSFACLGSIFAFVWMQFLLPKRQRKKAQVTEGVL